MSTIRELKALVKKKSNELAAYKDELESLEIDIQLPKLKKQYEGKYFVYDNGYNSSDRWNLYIYCHEVIGLHTGIFTTFQIDNYGECRFEIKRNSSLSLCQKEIGKERYMMYAKQFVDLANQILISK